MLNDSYNIISHVIVFYGILSRVFLCFIFIFWTLLWTMFSFENCLCWLLYHCYPVWLIWVVPTSLEFDHLSSFAATSLELDKVEFGFPSPPPKVSLLDHPGRRLFGRLRLFICWFVFAFHSSLVYTLALHHCTCFYSNHICRGWVKYKNPQLCFFLLCFLSFSFRSSPLFGFTSVLLIVL